MKNLYKKIMVALFALFLTIIPILTLVFMSPEKKPFSENENRYLAAFPELNFKSYKNESFMNGFDKWISDRFFGREDWIVLKNKTDSALGKTETNGVFIENGMMMQIWRDYDESMYQRNLKAINDFAEKHPEIPAYFMLVPNAQEIYKDNVPKYAEIGDQKEYIDKFYSELKGFEGMIDAFSALMNRRNSYIYYRTDHHWTSLGAFYGANAIFASMGLEPLELADYQKTTVTDQFNGTLFSSSGVRWLPPDSIDTYIPDQGIKVTSYFKGTPEPGSLYVDSWLAEKDKYSHFLGGRQPLCVVEKEGSGGPKVLIVRDSYSDSLTPFLTERFSEIHLFDPRDNLTSLKGYAEEHNIDAVIVLYSFANFISDSNLFVLAR